MQGSFCSSRGRLVQTAADDAAQNHEESVQVKERYLEAEDTADEEQNDEDQADVAESSDLILVWEVVRLHGGGMWDVSP